VEWSRKSGSPSGMFDSDISPSAPTSVFLRMQIVRTRENAKSGKMLILGSKQEYTVGFGAEVNQVGNRLIK
jgi:hypothetical protein